MVTSEIAMSLLPAGSTPSSTRAPTPSLRSASASGAFVRLDTINRADRNTFYAFGADEDIASGKGYLSPYMVTDAERMEATLFAFRNHSETDRLLAAIFREASRAEKEEDEQDPACGKCGVCKAYAAEIAETERQRR